MAHTPGPWKETKDGRIFSEGAKEWNRTLNAETSAWIAATGANADNARLIAAAPDLLAALQDVLQTTYIDADDADLALEALSSIRAICSPAIARAKGE